MKEVIDFLSANQMGSLATVEDGKPRVRPWGFMLAQDGKLWFCTSNNKDVFHQLQKNPAMEFTSSTAEFATIRVRGEVTFSNDMEMKKTIIKSNPMVKSVYQTAENPIFEIFFLEHGKAVLSDFSGQPPRIFEF